MMWFRRSSTADYRERISAAAEKGDHAQAEKIARDAFADPKADESLLVTICHVLSDLETPRASGFLHTFTRRYPESLGGMEVYLALLYTRQGRDDACTNEARSFLRKALDAGILPDLVKTDGTRNLGSLGFLLLTAAYCTLGARSYSRMVFQYSRQFSLQDSRIEEETAKLNRELEESEAREMDEKWEAFFSGGTNAGELYKLCERSGFPVMAARVDLLESRFRYVSTYVMGEEEMLQLVYETKDGIRILS